MINLKEKIIIILLLKAYWKAKRFFLLITGWACNPYIKDSKGIEYYRHENGQLTRVHPKNFEKLQKKAQRQRDFWRRARK